MTAGFEYYFSTLVIYTAKHDLTQEQLSDNNITINFIYKALSFTKLHSALRGIIKPDMEDKMKVKDKRK